MFLSSEEAMSWSSFPMTTSRDSFNPWTWPRIQFGWSKGKIEKVPRGIQGKKSNKDTASSRNLVSTIGAQASPKKEGQNQVSGRISVPCWLATPVTNAPWKLLVIRWRSSFGIKIMKLVESLICLEVTITGQGSECHLTFVREILHIAE